MSAAFLQQFAHFVSHTFSLYRLELQRNQLNKPREKKILTPGVWPALLLQYKVNRAMLS